MNAVLIILALWFMLAHDKTAKQNILAIFGVAMVAKVALWIF